MTFEKKNNMENQVHVNFTTKEIVISKQFNSKAKRYGSDEYKELIRVRKDFPDYEVKVRTTTPRRKSCNSFKGLTYDYMENYIKTHDDENGTHYKEYVGLRPTIEKGFDKNDPINSDVKDKSYGVVKKWFLNTYKFTEDKKEVA